jgi:hypothetical protein
MLGKDWNKIVVVMFCGISATNTRITYSWQCSKYYSRTKFRYWYKYINYSILDVF